jgi:hypothetical protein
LLTCLLNALGLEGTSVVLSEDLFSPFIEQHCLACHGPKKQKGKMRLDTLSLKLSDNPTATRWQDILDALNAGDMPPEDEEQPDKAALIGVLAELTSSLKVARHRLSEQGREVAMRRLNRREYIHTIESIFGFRLNPDVLPEDDPADPFDTIGAQQYFSSYHFDKYIELGRDIVADAFKWGNRGRKKSELRVEQPETRTNEHIRTGLKKRMDRWREVVAALEAGKTWKDDDFPRTLKDERFDGRELHYYLNFHAERSGEPQRYLKRELIDQGMYLTRRGGVFSAGHGLHGYDPRGTYKVRIVAGINKTPPESRTFVSVNDKGWVLPPLKIYGTVHHPETVEIMHKPRFGGDHFSVQILERRNGMIDGKRYVDLVDPYGDTASIYVERMEVEGPFYDELTRFEQLAFPKGPPKNGRQPPERSDADARALIDDFVFEAFRRRPGSPEFLQRLHSIYDQGRASGMNAEGALVDPLAAVLASPGFVYLSEAEPAAKNRAQLTDREFAVRLAYFLWSRPPDDELYRLAEEGTLREPGILPAQVDRLLSDPRSQAFSYAFISQWFDLHRFDEIVVNPKEYMMFDEEVRYSARREPIRFFEQILKENLSIENLIDSDFVVVNPLLAEHYGIKGVTGQGFRKVPIPEDSPRGGLIGTTAFMTMGATGDRTSPIIRGTLVLDKFLHDPPASPPPNVPELNDAAKEPLPIKAMIELHQARAQCASCHVKIDPIGYGLETFDAVGLWRDKAMVGKNEVAIETRGTLPDGQTYANYEAFKSLLLQHKDKLAESLVEGIVSYGLGRSIEFSDKLEIDQMVESLKQDGYRTKTLIHSLVQSPLFATK